MNKKLKLVNSRKDIALFIEILLLSTVIYIFWGLATSKVYCMGDDQLLESISNLSKLIYNERVYKPLNVLNMEITNVLLSDVYPYIRDSKSIVSSLGCNVDLNQTLVNESKFNLARGDLINMGDLLLVYTQVNDYIYKAMSSGGIMDIVNAKNHLLINIVEKNHPTILNDFTNHTYDRLVNIHREYQELSNYKISVKDSLDYLDLYKTGDHHHHHDSSNWVKLVKAHSIKGK